MGLNTRVFKPVVILALVAIVVSGIGFISFYRSETKSIESGAPAGFVKYQNEELGLSFFYPQEWGEVKYEKDTRNHPEKSEEWEPVKSHFLTFSDSLTYIVISPSDWKFTGPESEWDFPALHEITFDDYRNLIMHDGENSLSILLNTAEEFAFLYYGEFDDSLHVEGVKSIDLPKVKAEGIELRRVDYDFDHSCLKEHENEYGRYYTALDCFSPQDREEFVEVLKSINSI